MKGELAKQKSVGIEKMDLYIVKSFNIGELAQKRNKKLRKRNLGR